MPQDVFAGVPSIDLRKKDQVGLCRLVNKDVTPNRILPRVLQKREVNFSRVGTSISVDRKEENARHAWGDDHTGLII
jgi:hypothetical protein